MEIQVGSYVVFSQGTKKLLAQVYSIGDSTITATLDKNRQQSPEEVTFNKDDILAVLGQKPPLGSVFGVSVEPYWKTIDHDDWGEIHVYCRPNKTQWKAVKDGLSQAWKTLEREKLTGFVEAGNLRIELRGAKGKNLGMYYHRQKGETAADRMFFRLQETDHPDLYREVVLHESGHGVFYRLMTPQQRATWIKLHKRFAKFAQHTKNDIVRMRTLFLKSRQFLKDFAADLTDEAEILLFHECISNMRANYRLKSQHIDELMEVGDIQTISDMWPKDALDYTDFEQAINDYASSNPHELMAEAFRLYHTKTQLPEVIKNVLEKQLRACSGR